MKPPECSFCVNPSTTGCAWPVERMVLDSYGYLAVGDRVQRARQSPKIALRPPAVVEAIEEIGFHEVLTNSQLGSYVASGDRKPARDWLKVTLRIGQKIKVIQVMADSPVMVERVRPCGQAACVNHVRMVGDRRGYCMDHWNAWQAVA